MAAVKELALLLRGMKPKMSGEEYVFCTLPGRYQDYLELEPLASFMETEGLTLIITAASAIQANISYQKVYKQITLTIHSSLEAVGLTAAISKKLTEQGISANILAGYYHDHIFVAKDDAQDALSALHALANDTSI